MFRSTNHSIFNLKARPYNLLGIAGLMTGLMSFLPIHQETLEINLRDTYLVIAAPSICRIFAVVLLFLWSLYLVSDHLMLSRKLSWFHIVGTLLCLVFLFFFSIYKPDVPEVPMRYYAFTGSESQRPGFNISNLYIPVVLILLLAQLFFSINLTMGSIKVLFQKKQVMVKRVTST